VDSQSSSNSRRVDASKARLFGRLEVTGISPTAFLAALYLASRDFSGID
jgi:hypothetical protein